MQDWSCGRCQRQDELHAVIQKDIAGFSWAINDPLAVIGVLADLAHAAFKEHGLELVGLTWNLNEGGRNR